MDAEQIKAAREIISAATPGPWTYLRAPEYGIVVNPGPWDMRLHLPSHDAEFISAARAGWPEALGCYEAAEQHNKILRQQSDILGIEIQKLRAENGRLTTEAAFWNKLAGSYAEGRDKLQLQCARYREALERYSRIISGPPDYDIGRIAREALGVDDEKS